MIFPKANVSQYAKDVLMSLASKLPENLLLDAVSEHGRFCIPFLVRLKEEQLCDLRKECRDKKEGFFLMFYQVPENNPGNESPKEIRNFNDFDLDKVIEVKFNGNCAPLLEHNYLNPTYYVSATLVVKD